MAAEKKDDYKPGVKVVDIVSDAKTETVEKKGRDPALKVPAYPEKNPGDARANAESYLLVLEDRRDDRAWKVRFISSPGGAYSGQKRILSRKQVEYITEPAPAGWENNAAIRERQDYEQLVKHKEKDPRVFGYYPTLVELL